MKGKNRQLFRDLCEETSAVQDPKKLTKLIKQIDRIHGKKQASLKTKPAK
jgi:hypothetical protein